MPAQMTMEKSIARVCGEPGGQVVSRCVGLTAFVTDMRKAVRAMRVVWVCRYGFFDFRPRDRELPIFGQRHGMIGQEPEIVAVVWREAVHQHRNLPLLPNSAR